jgi:uncharacterized protein
MHRDEILAKLRQTEPALRARGVAALYLFGSHARDGGSAESDVDVFVDPVSDEAFGFLEFMGAYQDIQNAVGRDVDIGYSTRDGLSRYIKPQVEREAIKVF